MTPDQKEALTRPIIGIENRTASEVFDIMSDRIRALAASQPAPADALHGPYGYLIMPEGLAEDEWYLADDPRADAASEPLYAKREIPLGKPAPAADTGQAVNVEAIAKVISLSYGENPEDDAPLGKICGPNNEPLPNWEAYREQAAAVFVWMMAVIDALEKPAPSADTGQAVAWPRLTSAMIEAACRAHFGTDNVDGVDLTANDVNWSFRDAFKRMWKGAWSAYRAPDYPAPLDAEHVREDERDRLYELAKHSDSLTGFAASGWIQDKGAMSRADRAALRQKEGAA